MSNLCAVAKDPRGKRRSKQPTGRSGWILKVGMSDITISHQPKSHEFVLEEAGKRLGYLDYTLTQDNVITIEYVQVDPALRGTGMGNRLVEAAVAWARERDLSVQARCSFARAVLNAAQRR